MQQNLIRKRTTGCLLGTALGDALGLPYEGIRALRAARMFGKPDRFCFLFGRGMMSDDTEHTCLVAQSLLDAAGDIETFRTAFGRRLRWWLVALPAGTGLATLRACLRLWLGLPPDRSGVDSAGNGPAMRSAILGVCIEDPKVLRNFVKVSTRVTHSDPRAEAGALAIALAAHMACRREQVMADDFLGCLKHVGAGLIREDSLLMNRLGAVAASVDNNCSTQEFACSLGLDGFVSGFVDDTIPVVIHAWLSHPNNWLNAVQSVIVCGGDTDTMAAIAGAIVGCRVGPEGIDEGLRHRFVDSPRSIRWLEELGTMLAVNDAFSQVEVQKSRRSYSFIATLMARNLLFIAIVVFHGFRRLLPPY